MGRTTAFYNMLHSAKGVVHMDRFGGPKPGSVYLRSGSDPRWDCDICVKEILISSGELPVEAKEKIQELTNRYGEPPNDLEIAMWKD